MLLRMFVWSLIAFFIGTQFAEAEVRYLVPNSLSIRLLNGAADFQIVPSSDGLYAKIVFEPDYSNVLIDSASSDTVLKPALEFRDVDFSHLEKEGWQITKQSFDADISANQIAVTVLFNPRITEEEIRRLVNSSSIFGFVEINVRCGDFEDQKYCGAPLGNLPLKNQFRDAEASAEWLASKSEYDLLVSYRNSLLLKDFVGHARESLDKAAKSNLNLPSCTSLSDSLNKICATIVARSVTGSMSDSIDGLAKLVYKNAAPMDRSKFAAVGTAFEYTTEDSFDSLTTFFCSDMQYGFNELIEEHMKFQRYSTSHPEPQCTIFAKGKNFVDVKYMDDRGLMYKGANYGLGFDAIFRITRFGCTTRSLNVEGTPLEGGVYTLPPEILFRCKGDSTSSTSCYYTPKELKNLTDYCSSAL